MITNINFPNAIEIHSKIVDMEKEILRISINKVSIYFLLIFNVTDIKLYFRIFQITLTITKINRIMNHC